MKYLCNYILILVVLITMVDLSQSQDINYGVSVGLSESSLDFNDEYYNNRFNPENNYNIAAFVEFPSYSNLKFQSGLKYFGISSNVIDLGVRSFSTRHDVQLSYLAIPLNANYYLPFFTTMFFSGGLELAYLLSASITEINNIDNSTTSDDVSDQYNNFSLLFGLGIGFEFPMGNFGLVVKTEYTKSFENVNKWSPIATDYGIETISLNLGIKF